MNLEPKKTVFRCRRCVDRVGEFEEFTADLDYISKATSFSHLTSSGLPKVGTRVQPGMVLVGKIGRKSQDIPQQMNELERLIASERQLEEYYSSWLYDASLYAPPGCFGTVTAAYFDNAKELATVEITLESDNPRTG